MIKRRRELIPADIETTAVRWFRARVDLEGPLGMLAKKQVPKHRYSWIYTLGGAALFLFVFQVATGCLMMLYYQPSEATAHETVTQIMNEVPYGWLVRSTHAWGATLFIAIVGLHFLTVLFANAYRKPRELTWLTGMGMLGLALAFGFSGYLLPWNDRAYYATLVGTKIPAVLPVVGDFAVLFLRGGDQVTGATLTRFFGLHVALLPLAFNGLLAVHLLLVQFQGMSLPLGMSPAAVRDRRPFFSEFLLIDGCVWLALFGGLLTLAVLSPAEIGQKADLLKPAPEGIRPEWFFLFMFKTLKVFPEAVGVALLALGAALLVFLPFVDRSAARERRSPLLLAILLAMLAYVTTFEFLAWIAPEPAHARETLSASTYSLSRGAVSLAMFWTLIGFLMYYLRRLLRENERVRRLYSPPDEVVPAAN